jgi:hypothetical protein
MRTRKQTDASRANGALSRGPLLGPNLPEMEPPDPALPDNALPGSNSRIRTDLARTVVLDNESRHRFDVLHNSLTQEFEPGTPTERLLVSKMAVAYWRQMRVWAFEKSTICDDVTHDEVRDALTRDALTFAGKPGYWRNVSQYESGCDRQFSRALQRLLELRAARQTNFTQPEEEE